jgi:hypothetical protein
MPKMLRLGAIAAVLAMCTPGVWAQSLAALLLPSSAHGSPTVPASVSRAVPAAPPETVRPFSQVAVGVKVGILGGGVELATPLTRRTNLRVGGNYLSYTDHLTNSGVDYQVGLKFGSAEASLDWFPWGRSFHISPGALVYNANQITANGMVPAGTSFTINGTNYVSNPVDPVNGNANIGFAHASPKLTVGWGNLIPRSRKHFSFPFEVGFAYVGDPTVKLNFAGSACNANGQGCEPVATSADIQSNIAAEQQKFQRDANYARFFPLLSMGYSYRF